AARDRLGRGHPHHRPAGSGEDAAEAMTARRFILALDQGTTGSRALVVDPEGAVRGSGYVELPQHYPKPGWGEHDAGEIWETTAPFCERLKSDGHEAEFRRKTGLVLDPYFSGTKIRWLLDEVPEARQRAERGELCFGTVDSWLLWRLTGGAVHATDPTNASRTL